MLNDMLKKIREDAQKHFDDEIRKSFTGIRTDSNFQQKSSDDILSDLNDMIFNMTTLIMCSPKNKELLEKMKDELPHMTKIFENSLLADDELYLITDEELKKSMLECMEIRKGGGRN